jgi:hypothetical protein
MLNASNRDACTSHTERGKTKKKVWEIAIFAVLADRSRRYLMGDGGVDSIPTKAKKHGPGLLHFF